MSIQFGHIYEKQSGGRPSRIIARAYFFRIFSELRSNAINALSEIAASAFLRLIEDNSKTVSKLHDEVVETRGYSSKKTLLLAYEKFAPDWKALLQKPSAGRLRTALLEWSARWNLSDEWILDQAISFLRIFYGRRTEVTSNNPSIRQRQMEVLIIDAWRDAIEDLKLRAERISFMLPSLIEAEMELPDFSFEQKGLAFSHSSEVFLSRRGKQIVEQKFDKHMRQIEGVNIPTAIIPKTKARFQNALDPHIRKIKQIARQHGYAQPLYKIKNLDDFIWLIKYLVPKAPGERSMTQEEIAKLYQRPLEAVSDGMDRAAKLLGINKQPVGYKRGRKKGQTGSRKLKAQEAKDKAERLSRTVSAIVALINEKRHPTNKAIAELIGITANHFGREWRPDVLIKAQKILGLPKGVSELTWERFIEQAEKKNPKLGL